MSALSKIGSLLYPTNLIQSIKDHKMEIKGIFVLSLAIVLEILIIIPLSMIVLGKTFLENPTDFLNGIQSAFTIICLTLLFVPLAYLLFDGTILFLTLKLFKSPITYSKTILARTIGLIPLIIFIPLKALLYSPSTLVANFFWPPWIGILVTQTSELITYPAEIQRFIIQDTTLNQVKILITLLLLTWTFFRTSRYLKELGEISKKYAYLATIVQLIIWDITALLIAIAFSLAF